MAVYLAEPIADGIAVSVTIILFLIFVQILLLAIFMWRLKVVPGAS